MVFGTYTSNAKVYALTGLSTAEVGTADMGTILRFADAEVERITRRVWTGQMVEELVGRGDGTSDVFHTAFFPVLDAFDPDGSITDDEGDVEVLVDGATINSASYTLTGAEGRIKFVSGAVPSTDAKVEVTYYHSLERVRQCATFFASAYAMLRVRKGDSSEWKDYQEEAMKLAEGLGKKLMVGWTR